MEATHLGALHARAQDGALDEALAVLAVVPAFPANAGALVARDGTIDPAVVRAVAAWLAPAVDIVARVADPGMSLGVPTWRYGHEPTSVFATHIAKYFENSVREDGLLSVAAHGVVYARGGAGTLQEVFQDAVFNVYADEDRKPSPMVFLGRAFWEGMGVLPVLSTLFGAEGFARYVTVTDDLDRIVDLLTRFDPAAPKALIRSDGSRPTSSFAALRLDALEPEGGSERPV